MYAFPATTDRLSQTDIQIDRQKHFMILLLVICYCSHHWVWFWPFKNLRNSHQRLLKSSYCRNRQTSGLRHYRENFGDFGEFVTRLAQFHSASTPIQSDEFYHLVFHMGRHPRT